MPQPRPSPRCRLRRVAFIGIAANALGAAPGALANTHAAVSYDPAAAVASQPETPADGAPPADAAATPEWGESGAWSWTVGAGAAVGGSDSTAYANAFVSFDYFLVDDFEIGLEAAGWFFDQDGDRDAGGGSFIVNFRWHFLKEEERRDWTVFANIGAGLLGATNEVPPGGSEFNFMPRAGMGFTLRLGDGPERLTGGIQWQHFSNGRIFGSDRNPGTDAVMFYLGVTFPF